MNPQPIEKAVQGAVTHVVLGNTKVDLSTLSSTFVKSLSKPAWRFVVGGLACAMVGEFLLREFQIIFVLVGIALYAIGVVIAWKPTQYGLFLKFRCSLKESQYDERIPVLTSKDRNDLDSISGAVNAVVSNNGKVYVTPVG